MDVGNEGTGTVTEATANFCEISADIDGSKHTLMINRNIFYTFGIRCEGHLTNLLEEGTELSICYTYEYQSKPVVTVAWLGEKPKLDKLKPIMEDVYDQSGRVYHVLVDVGYIVRSDKLPYRVKVSKEVVYRDGCPNKVDLVVGDGIKFDAIPVEQDSDSEYQATCAWIGAEPRLVVRFGLDISESLDVLDDLSGTRFYGTVVVIPNDVVAFANVEMSEINESVMLFRSSFDHKCERIQDIVRVGDSLCMHLSFRCIFHGCRQWFAVRAWRNSPDQKGSEENSKLGDKLSTRAEVDQPVSCSTSTSSSDAFTEKEEDEDEALPIERSTLSKEDKVLHSDPPLTGVLFLFLVPSTAVARYGPDQLKIYITRNIFFINGMPCKNQDDFISLARSGNTVVSFEGVRKHENLKKREESDKIIKPRYLATCAWIGEKPSLVTVVSESVKLPVAQSLLQNHNITFYGTVVQFYLPHRAIILVGLMNQIACLHITSFLSEEGDCSKDCLITDFVQLKDRLSFKLVEDHACEIPVRAVDVTVLTGGEYREHLSRALCRNSELYKVIDNWRCQSGSTDKSLFPGEAFFQTCELTLQASARRFDKDSKVLFSDPPLKGVLSGLLNEPNNTKKAVITYGSSLSVCVMMSRFYIFGVRCQNFDDFVVLAELGRTIVNFEGILVNREGLEREGGYRGHYVTCAWIGEKPSLSTVFEIQQSENVENLESIISKSNVTFYGKVVKFFLPDKALVKVDKSLLNQYACLHVSSFLNDNYVQSENNFINDFVQLGDCLSFKLVQDPLCEIFLQAVNAKVISKEKLEIGCAREAAENPDLFKNRPFLQATGVLSSKPDVFLCSNNENVLFSDPPLCGSFELTSSKKAVISYEDIEIDLSVFCLFRGKWSCCIRNLRQAIKTVETVYFEAIPRDSSILREQRPYYASLAWVDQKPSLNIVARVAQFLGPQKPSNGMPMIVLRDNDRTYVGSIYWIYLPDDALILLYLNGERVIVRLNKGEFEREAQPAGKRSYITDYIYFQEIVRFRMRRDDLYCGGLCAYDVVKSTEDDLRAFHEDSKDWVLKLGDEPLFEETLLDAFDATITTNAKYKRTLLQVVADKPHLFSNIITTRYQKQAKMECRPNVYVGDRDDCDFMHCEDKTVLFADPPLSGQVIWNSTRTAVILYKHIKIDVPVWSVPRDKVHAKCADTSQTVYFEAIPRIVSRKGLNPYFATLAWLGNKKPSLLSISRSVESEHILIWRFIDRTFVGKVIRFSLPNDAVILTEIRGELTVACLHKSAFLSMFEPEKPYISDYVRFLEYLEFKIKPNKHCRVGVCAYNVMKSSVDDYQAFCERSKHWIV